MAENAREGRANRGRRKRRNDASDKSCHESLFRNVSGCKGNIHTGMVSNPGRAST